MPMESCCVRVRLCHSHISSVLEVATKFEGEILAPILLLARSWRVVRVAYGVFEARHKYENAIAEEELNMMSEMY